MKGKIEKMFKAAAFVCCFLVVGAAAAYGQLPDIPGSTGSPVRPDRSAAEDATSRREAREKSLDANLSGARMLTLRTADVNDQFAEYSAIDKVLGVSIDALREEYDEERQEIPVLQPKHLFTVKLLVRSANKVRPGKVTKGGFLDKMQGGVRPAAYLQSRGFTEPEIRAIFTEVEKTLAQIKADSRR